LFGSINHDNARPSRLIVRDAYLTVDSISNLQDSEFTDLPFSEIKAENTIDRRLGVAKHPRFIERIPAGAKFKVEFVINIVAETDADTTELETEFINLLKTGIRLLEDDYLGGSGSRGYGQVKFTELKITEKTAKEYFDGN